MKIGKITVVGAGTMGNGIAHVFALKDFKVDLIDTKKDLLNSAIKTIESNLDRQIKKEIISNNEKVNALKNIKCVVSS